MEIVVKENIANQPMKNSPYVLGEIPAPDAHYKPVLYSYSEAEKQLKELDRDIYEKQQKARPINEKKTPKSVFVGLALAALTALFFVVKHFVKK